MLLRKVLYIVAVAAVSAKTTITFPPKDFRLHSGSHFAVVWTGDSNKRPHAIYIIKHSSTKRFPKTQIPAGTQAHIFPDGLLKEPGRYTLSIEPGDGGPFTNADVDVVEFLVVP